MPCFSKAHFTKVTLLHKKTTLVLVFTNAKSKDGFHFSEKRQERPWWSGGKTVLSMQGTQVQLLVKELDHQVRVHMLQQRPGAAKINKCFKKKKRKKGKMGRGRIGVGN